jgi:hypothetical protein
VLLQSHTNAVLQRTVNGLTQSNTGFDNVADYNAVGFTGFNYVFDINKIGPNKNQAGLIQANGTTLSGYHTSGQYGGGLTITALNQPIFFTVESAKFLNIPYVCSKLDYQV